MLFDGRPFFTFIGLFNQGINDESLTTGFQFPPDQAISPFAFFGIQDKGLDSLAAWWHLVDDREIQIPINRQCQGTRDGGSRHHQKVGIGTLGAQRGALFHAEAMLLINDRQFQICIFHRVFDQSVRADHHFDQPRSQPFPDFAFLGFGGGTYHQADLMILKRAIFTRQQA